MTRAPGASLRTALTRLGRCHGDLLRVSATELLLNPGVRVNLRDAQANARRLLRDVPLSMADRRGDGVGRLSLDLLPGWYDDWVLIEAEAWRQLRLHALEALSVRLTVACCHAEAILVALAAVAADPLWGSARSVLISAYLAEGNRSEALREFDSYRQLVHAALGVEPTSRLRVLAGADLRVPCQNSYAGSELVFL